MKVVIGIVAVIVGFFGGLGVGLAASHTTTTDPLGTTQTARSYITRQLGNTSWTDCSATTGAPCVTTTANGIVYQIDGAPNVASVVVSLDYATAGKLPQAQQVRGGKQYNDALQHFAQEPAAYEWIGSGVAGVLEGGTSLNLTQRFDSRITFDGDATGQVITVTFTDPN